MSVRAWIVACVGIAFICWAVSTAELLVVQAGFLQLPPASLVLLGLLIGFRMALGRQAFKLTDKELATLYCMSLIAALVASRGLMEKLVSLLVAPNYFARPANHWAEDFFPFLKPWSVAFRPTGPSPQFVSRAYYEGLSAGQSLPWRLWVRPLMAWSVLIAFVFGAFVSLASLLARPWVEHERLAFPLVRLPEEMIRAEGRGSLFRNPMMWIGFGIPAFVYSLNSLKAWFPSLPSIPLMVNVNDVLTSPPWNALSWTPVVFTFAGIGLMYLVPLDLLFSLWFFFLATRLSEGVLTGFGMEMPDMPVFPCRLFVGYQVVGAYVVLAFGLLRTALPYWRESIRKPREADGKDLIPPRVALVTLGGCMIGMTLWSQALGQSFGWALFQWSVYLFVVCLVMTRSVSEGGVLMTETSFRPVDLYAIVSPIHALGRGNMVGNAMLDAAWYRDQRGLVLTGLMDAMKIGSVQAVKRGPFLRALVVALGLATVFSAVIQVWLPYRYGALRFYDYLAQGNPIWFFGFYGAHVNNSVPPPWQGAFFFGVGSLVTAGLISLRSLFPGWPLMPLGYALCGSWTMILLWFPCLLVWVVKGGILRYGGRKTYHRLTPLFLGMVLGEFTMAVIWSAASALAGIPAPAFPWP